MQLALIVDDSKTARVMLRKMLAKHDIPVAMVESGEEAISYLQENHPDVIFMDHMMPGMDGFTAVKAIKSDPETSRIPIVMHTTKQGEVYVGQARALGASDILSKPVTDKELVEVLDRVREEGDAARVTLSAEKDVEQVDAVTVELLDQPEPELEQAPAAESIKPAATSPVASSSADLEQAVPELRRAANDQGFLGSFRQWVVATIWLIPTIWLLALYFEQQELLRQAERDQQQLLASFEWSLNQQREYDYGELPLGDNLLERLQEVVSRLESANFTGIIRLEGHVGEFCLAMLPLEDGSELGMLPPPEEPLLDCDVIGVSASRAMQAAVEQSSSFTRFIQNYRNGDIRIEVLSYGSSRPREPYPDNLEALSTGDWNSIALTNNRVEFKLIQD